MPGVSLGQAGLATLARAFDPYGSCNAYMGYFNESRASLGVWSVILGNLAFPVGSLTTLGPEKLEY